MLNTHMIRLGTHPEKEYLLLANEWFDEVVLNANLVEGTASSLGVFALELQNKGKGFLIDPVTYAFALDPVFILRRDNAVPARAHIKRTFGGLARRYGSVVDRYAGVRALQPDDFAIPGDRDELVSSVLGYQRDRLNEALEESAYFLDQEAAVSPSRLLAPYFHLSRDLDWLDVAVDLADRTYTVEPQAWVVLCFDSLLLDDSQRLDAIIQGYNALKTPGLLLWATDFEEERASIGQIRGLRRLITELSRGKTRPVISLFGGYFSCLLAEYGLTGISHGLAYGERRDIQPVVGGGLPPARFYLPAAHKQVRMDQFASIVIGLQENEYADQVCNCLMCLGLLNQGMNHLVAEYTAADTRLVNGRYRQVATPRAYRLTRFHYLANKDAEFRHCAQRAHSDLLLQLQQAYDHFSAQLGGPALLYLLTWNRALS